MLNCTTPLTAFKLPSTADVQAPHVMPSIAMVVVVSSGPWFHTALLVLSGSCDNEGLVSIIVAPNPRSSIISATASADIVDASCSITARSDSSDILIDRTPETSLKPPSTAEVHAPHVIPSMAKVVVYSADRFLEASGSISVYPCAFPAAGRSVERTSASKPRSSIMSFIASGDNFPGSCWITALDMTRLTDTLPAPSTLLNALSTADVHAPHVIPSTRNVVVAMCRVVAIFANVPLGMTFPC